MKKENHIEDKLIEIITIQVWLDNHTDFSNRELAKRLNVSSSMISHYRKGFNASLDVAKLIYQLDGTVLHPFAEDSLQFEIGDSDDAL